MSQYEDDQTSDAAETAGEDAGQLPAEMMEQSEGEFVVETPKANRSAGMMLLLLLAAGGGGLYFMHMKAGPAAAVAASPESVTAKATITEFLTDGGKNIQAMRDLLRNTEKVVQQFAAYPSMTQVKLEELKTNPFRFTDPKVGETQEQAEKARLAREQEAEKEKLRRKQDVARAAGQLQVQTILIGSSPTCIIANQVYSEGQQVSGFTIEKITPGRVVVKKDSYRFELRMQR